MRQKRVRNIIEYNSKVPDREQIPYIVGIIDEYADLIMGAGNAGKDLETAVARLGQKARAAGIHLILATQRPTANVVTGLIKANMPGRLAYKVSSTIDSQVILDRPGAESLTGMGDLLLIGPADPEPIRAQGPLVTDEEIERIVDFWRREFQPATMETLRNPESNEKNVPELPEDEKIAKVITLHSKFKPQTTQPPLIKTEPENEQVEPDLCKLKSKEQKQNSTGPYNISESIWVEGKGNQRVNLGLPPRPHSLKMSNENWAIMYGYSVRLVVRDQAPRRDYLRVMLNKKIAVAQLIMQFLEERSIVSPYKGPNAQRIIYVTLEQVERVYPENLFSKSIYTSQSNNKTYN